MFGGAVDKPEPVTVLCPECQTLVEVKNIYAVLLALHMQNDCDVSNLLAHREAG